MQFWHQFPFVRIVAPFIAGTITAIYFQSAFALLPVILGVLVVVYILLALLLFRKFSYKYRYVNGLLINVLLFGLAYQLTIARSVNFQDDHVSKYLPAERIYISINEPISEKDKTFKIVAKTIAIEKDGELVHVSGKIILYFEKNLEVERLAYGDVLSIKANPVPVDPPSNPNQFNYKQYLSNRGIYHQAYVRIGDWRLLGIKKGNQLKALGISLRQQFLRILEQNNLTGKEYAVASAILLGYDEYLDAEQKRQFAGAGAMHILCVSGLHVGIIYLILNSLLKFLDRNRWARILKVLLLLLMIWFYALITGLSPSVMRAATMFSFIIIGQSLQRKTNIYNSLAASAFFLMLIDPYIITAVGFQLSYLAVLGIVTIFKPIYNIYIPGYWLLDQIWSITVVSIAATLATFPLSVFYFHQFPNYFLITNLVAIPASMLILYTGILVLITSPIQIISGLLAQILVWIIKALNLSVGWIEALPNATSNSIYISLTEVFLFFILITSLAFLILTKRKVWIFFTLGMSMFIIASFSVRKYHWLQQRNVVVYNVRNHSAIGILNGTQEIILTDSLFMNDERNIEFNIRPHLIASGVKKPVFVDLQDRISFNQGIFIDGSFVYAGGLKLVIINSNNPFVYAKNTTKLNVDHIVISGNPKINMKALIDQFSFKSIIFDSSNAPWNIQKWKADCESMGISCIIVAESGAWVANK